MLQLLYVDTEEPQSGHNALPLRSSLTPTKKVDVDRTIMPDGTIVTTVTTVQSRLKLERSPGRFTEQFIRLCQVRRAASNKDETKCTALLLSYVPTGAEWPAVDQNKC